MTLRVRRLTGWGLLWFLTLWQLGGCALEYAAEHPG